MTLFDELATVVATLERAGVDYALVGGLAVAVWGAPPATADIDLLIRPESAAAALEAVEPLGFRFPALPMTVKDGMSHRARALHAARIRPRPEGCSSTG